MQIEAIKTWQWMLIGAVIGLMFSGVISWKGPAYDSDDLETLDQGSFERQLMGVPISRADIFRVRKDVSMVENLVVHPPMKGDAAGDLWVTGQAFTTEPQRKDSKDPNSQMLHEPRWVNFRFEAKRPYKAYNGAVGNYPSIVEYLNAMKQRPDMRFTYRYAFWEVPAMMMTMPAVAGVLLIGIAWPMTINLMQRGGVVKKPAPKTAKLRKNRKATVALKADNSAKNKQLDDLNADLENSLASYASTSHAILDDEDDGIPVPVKPLPGAAPLPTTTSATTPQGEESHEYGGEFYPVAKTTHKK